MEPAATTTMVMIVISTTVILGLAGLIATWLGRRSPSCGDWAVGGHGLPFYVIVGTQYATAMGGGVLVAHVGIAYRAGWSVLSYGLLLCAGLLLFTIMAPWLRRQNFTTLPDVIESLYGSNRFLKAAVALVCLVVPFGWVCTQLVAFGKLFASLTGLPMPALIIAMAAVGLAIVIPAGLTSVAWTDFVFGCFMLATSLASLGFALELGGGWSNIVSTVPPELMRLPEGMMAVGLPTVLLWSLAILPGTLTNQMYYQRIYAIGNAGLVRTSLIASAMVFFSAEIWAGVLGLSLRAAKPDLAPELAAGWFLAQLPVWFLALYAGFIAATIVSTIDSAIQSSVVNLTRDIYKKLINPKVSDRELLFLSRWLSVVVAVVAAVWAIAWPQALGWLVATYAYSASALLFPIFLGYFLRGRRFLTPQGAVAGVLSGFLGCAIGQGAQVQIPYVAYGLAGSLFGLLVVSALTRKSHYRRLSPDAAP